MSVAAIAMDSGINANLLFGWRRWHLASLAQAVRFADARITPMPPQTNQHFETGQNSARSYRRPHHRCPFTVPPFPTPVTDDAVACRQRTARRDHFGIGTCPVALGRFALAGAKVHADDTPVGVLDPGCGRTKTGRLWVYPRDDRPGASKDAPAVWFQYSPDRKGEHPQKYP